MRKLALLCIFAAVCCIALAAGVFLRPAPAADPASGSVSAPVSSTPAKMRLVFRAFLSFIEATSCFVGFPFIITENTRRANGFQGRAAVV